MCLKNAKEEKTPPVNPNPVRGMMIFCRTKEFCGKYFLIRKNVFMIMVNLFRKSGADPQPPRSLEIFLEFVLFGHKIAYNIFDKTNASRYNLIPNKFFFFDELIFNEVKPQFYSINGFVKIQFVNLFYSLFSESFLQLAENIYGTCFINS